MATRQAKVSGATAQLYRLIFPNGKFYFGLCNNSERRWADHHRLATAGSKFPVHCAIRKYGWNGIVRQVLAVGNLNYIAALEVATIVHFKTRNRRFGYNLAPGGETGPMGDPRVARKVASTKKGKPLGLAIYEGLARWLAANSEAHSEKLSKLHTARWAAMDLVERAETLAKTAPKGRTPSNKGKKVTDPVVLQNIRDAAPSPSFLIYFSPPECEGGTGDISRAARGCGGWRRRAGAVAEEHRLDRALWLTRAAVSGRRVPPQSGGHRRSGLSRRFWHARWNIRLSVARCADGRAGLSAARGA